MRAAARGLCGLRGLRGRRCLLAAPLARGEARGLSAMAPATSTSTSTTTTTTTTTTSPGRGEAPDAAQEAGKVVPKKQQQALAKAEVEAEKKAVRARPTPTRWQKLQEALIPYRIGLRKFATNVGVAYDLIKWSLADLDRKLTRRERRLVLRTVLDLLKLVPFAVIAAAPGGSLLLPVLARYVPSTLPTTFNMPSRAELEKIARASEEEDSLKRRMDRDVKGAIERMVSSMHENQVSHYAEVRELLEEAAQAESLGEEASPLVMTKFSDADLLDILNLRQLELLASYFKLPLPGALRTHVVGAAALVDTYRYSMLRYQLSRYVAKINSDDVLLAEEDVRSLSDEDLRHACEARGLITTGASGPPLSSSVPFSREGMLASLNIWVLASVGRHVPVVILAFRNLDASAPGIMPDDETPSSSSS